MGVAETLQSGIKITMLGWSRLLESAAFELVARVPSNIHDNPSVLNIRHGDSMIGGVVNVGSSPSAIGRHAKGIA